MNVITLTGSVKNRAEKCPIALNRTTAGSAGIGSTVGNVLKIKLQLDRKACLDYSIGAERVDLSKTLLRLFPADPALGAAIHFLLIHNP
jgi:hypothetical protein